MYIYIYVYVYVSVYVYVCLGVSGLVSSKSVWPAMFAASVLSQYDLRPPLSRCPVDVYCSHYTI